MASLWTDFTAPSPSPLPKIKSEPQVAVLTPLPPVVVEQAAKPAEIKCSRRHKCIYLTFDDGPWGYTDEVLKLLKKHEVPATFFVIGSNISSHPREAKLLKASGMAVGNHSWGHEQLIAYSSKAVAANLLRTNRRIERWLGSPPTCYRPPYGATNARVRGVAKRLGLREYVWTVDPQDWRGASSHSIVKRVLRSVKPNGIILLHDGGGNRKPTVMALKKLLPKLKARGYTFRSLC